MPGESISQIPQKAVTINGLTDLLIISQATGNPSAPYVTKQATAALVGSACPLFTASTAGIVPGSGGGNQNFLRADGSWDIPPGSGGGGVPGGTNGQIQYNNNGNFGGFTASGDGTLNTGTGALTISKIGGVSISLAGAFSTVGAHTLAITTTGNTAITLPTSGTLATTAPYSGGSGVGLVPVGGTSGTFLRGDGTWAVVSISGVTVGTTTIASGTTGYVEYNNGGVLGELATNGTGNVILAAGTLAITTGKTATFSNTLTFTGTDSSSIAFGTGGTVVYTGVTTLSSLVSVGTIGTGTWQGSTVTGTYGGTGVNNGASTITIAGNVAVSGAHALTLTITADTTVTLPTSGTLATNTQYGGGSSIGLVPTGGSSTTFLRGDGAWATPSLTTITVGTTLVASGTNGFVLYNNAGALGNVATIGTGSVVLSAGTLAIASGKTLTASNSLTLAGTDSTTMTFPASSAHMASLDLVAQIISGGARITTFAIGTVTSGTTTVDSGNGPLQSLTNGGAFTLAAPSHDGSCAILVTNNGSAGTITFSGFSVSANTGDAYVTTNTDQFIFYIVRISGTSTYTIKALQ